MFGSYFESVRFAGTDSQLVWLGSAFAKACLHSALSNSVSSVFEEFPKIESFFVGPDLSAVGSVSTDCSIALPDLSETHSELALIERTLPEFSATEAASFVNL